MTQADSLDLVIERVFDAPRELVWKAWTDPEHVAQWWGPHGMKTRVDELDLRVGGNWRYVMTGPDGGEYPQQGTFREIVPPEKIVTSAVFEVGSDAPQRQVLTYRFDDLGDKTKLTMHIEHETAEQLRTQAAFELEGWSSNFDCLDEHLAVLAATG